MGIAVVHTARGLLLHYAAVAAVNVTNYAIVAPTEWNFHLSGAFVQELQEMTEANETHLKHRAYIAALSLAPCVAYEIGVSHA